MPTDPLQKSFFEAARANRINAWMRAGGDPNAKFAAGHTPLTLAARFFSPKPRVFTQLLEAGADATVTRPGGDTVLLLITGQMRDDFPDEATYLRHKRPLAPPAVLRRLIDAGAVPGVRDTRGRSALHRWMIRATEEAPFYPAKEADVAGAFDAFAGTPELATAADATGESPFHRLTTLPSGCLTLSRLIAAGVDPTLRTHTGRTALDYAAETYNTAALRLLLATRPCSQSLESVCRQLTRPWDHAANFFHIPQKNFACLLALLESELPLPAEIRADTSPGALLLYMRNHLRDEAPPLRGAKSVHFHHLLPYIRRSEAWWMRHLPRFSKPVFAEALLANPHCPDSVKDCVRLAGI